MEKKCFKHLSNKFGSIFWCSFEISELKLIVENPTIRVQRLKGCQGHFITKKFKVIFALLGETKSIFRYSA